MTCLHVLENYLVDFKHWHILLTCNIQFQIICAHAFKKNYLQLSLASPFAFAVYFNVLNPHM